MTRSSLDVPEPTSGANSSFETERHQHHNRNRQRHAGLTIAPGVTTSPIWSDLPSRILEGQYRIGPTIRSNNISTPCGDTNMRVAYQNSEIRPSMYNQYSHPSSFNYEDHRNEHSTMLPLVDHPNTDTIPPDWPYQVGPSQPVLLRNFNSPVGTNSRQRFYSPSEMIPRKRSRLTWATYLILLTLLISSATAAILFFSGLKHERSSEVTSATARTNAPSSDPVRASSIRTSNTNSNQQDSPSSVSIAYYYYYYYPNPAPPSGINPTGDAGTNSGELKMPSPSPPLIITPTAVSNLKKSPSSTAGKNYTVPSLSFIKTNNNSTTSFFPHANGTLSFLPNNATASNGTEELRGEDEGLKSIGDTKQLSNVTNNDTIIVQTPVGAPSSISYTISSATQSNTDDPFPADSLNDDRIRTGDDVTNILSSANNIEVDTVTGAITTMDDATSKVTTSLGNDKTDDDPISSYPTSDSKVGANLTFQGYDDGFDDTVHDDAFSVDDTLENGEYSSQVETALTGTSGTEFIPQESDGSSNFDFGGKEDDFASKSSTNTDFGSSLSDLNLSNGDDFSVVDSVRSGDDFQSIIDGISTSIIKNYPSNHTSSNLTSLINNTESINYANESSNLNYSAPTSNPLTTDDTSVTLTPSVVQPTYTKSSPPTTVPLNGTNIVTPSQPAPASIPGLPPSVKLKKDITSPFHLLPFGQPVWPSKPSFSLTPSVVPPWYTPSKSPTMVPMKESSIVTPTHPTQASIPSLSPSVKPKKDGKGVDSKPSTSYRPGRSPMYDTPPKQPAWPSTSYRPDSAPFSQPTVSSQPSSSPTMDLSNFPNTAPSLQQPIPYLQNSISPSKEYLTPPNLYVGDNSVIGVPSSTKGTFNWPPFLPGGGYYYYYYYYPPSSRRK